MKLYDGEDYYSFISSKQQLNQNSGFNTDKTELNLMLFEFQKDIAWWNLLKGRSADFADCGLGKTPIQLEVANNVLMKENKPILILAPLAVSKQTKREGEKFGIDVNICESQSDVITGINITNYEKLHKFNPKEFVMIVLDESSILKNYSGKIRNQIIESFHNTKYRLACTATPSPNDYMELGNHAEFLGIMKRTEMLSTFFVHDGGETSKWRLKGHSETDFWKWLSSWAMVLRKPSDLGYEDNGFILPEMKIIEHVVESDKQFDGELFKRKARTLTERRQAHKDSINLKIEKTLEIISENPDEQHIIWVNYNHESELLSKAIPNAIEIAGKHTDQYKEDMMLAFAAGEIQNLVTKASIAGFGMNWQNCHNVIYFGLNDSYEGFYQSSRRTWRFGQKEVVKTHIIISDTEGNVIDNIKRKESDSNKMYEGMIEHMQDFSKSQLHGNGKTVIQTGFSEVTDKKWEAIKGDNIEIMRNKIKDNSIDYLVTSTPFPELYTYSDDPRDLGNCKDYTEFFEQFKYFAREVYRIIKPGRLASFHCPDIPMMKEKHGVIGLYDFPGDLLRALMGNELNEIINTRNYMLELFGYKNGQLQVDEFGQFIGYFDSENIQHLFSKEQYDTLKNLDNLINEIALKSNKFIYHSKNIVWKDPLVEVTRTKALGLMHKQLQKDSSMCRAGLPDYIITVRKPGENKEFISHPNGFKSIEFPGQYKTKQKGIKRSHEIWQKIASPVWMDIRQGNTLQRESAREEKDEKHICPLQLDVIERLLLLYSNENDLILDPYAGIGSVGWESIKLNRRFLGMELKESYYNQMIRNLENAKSVNNQGTLLLEFE